MKIKTVDNLDSDLAKWNDAMYLKFPTPHEKGLAGIVQAARVRTVKEFAAIQVSDRVLELGCESGHLLYSLPPATRIVGGDISGKALEDAAALLESAGKTAELYQLDAQKPLPFRPVDFDVIICSEMLEHVESPRAVLENIHRITRPDARVVVSIPLERPKLVIKKILFRLGLFQIFFRGIEEGQSEWHLQVFSLPMLRNLVADLFTIHRVKLVWWNHYVVLMERK